MQRKTSFPKDMTWKKAEGEEKQQIQKKKKEGEEEEEKDDHEEEMEEEDTNCWSIHQTNILDTSSHTEDKSWRLQQWQQKQRSVDPPTCCSVCSEMVWESDDSRVSCCCWNVLNIARWDEIWKKKKRIGEDDEKKAWTCTVVTIYCQHPGCAWWNTQYPGCQCSIWKVNLGDINLLSFLTSAKTSGFAMVVLFPPVKHYLCSDSFL